VAADDTLAEILRKAYGSVRAAELPESLAVVAFEKAVELLAGTGAPATPAPTAEESNSPDAAASPPASGGPKSLERVAAKLKLSLETVNEVFHLDGETIGLSIASSKLPKAKLAATKELALLLTAARQAGGWDEEWTTSDELRSVAEEFGKFDPPNFAKALTEQGEYFGFQGKGVSRKIKVNRKGLEEAAILVKKLAGEDES
jgi:hypothetical protein